MPDQEADKPVRKPGWKLELSTEMRLLIAFALTGLVLLVSNYVIKPQAPPAGKKTPPAQAKTVEAPKPVPPPETPQKQAAKAKPEKAAAPVMAEKEASYTVETDLYRVVFSNRGATVRSWVLKKYKYGDGKQLDLVNAAGASEAGYPFLLQAREGKKFTADVNAALFQAKPQADGLGIEFEFSDGKLKVRKHFHFQKNRYLAELSTEVIQEGTPVPHVVVWRGGFGDQSVQGAAASQHTLHYNLTDAKLVTKDVKAAKDGVVSETGPYSFAGIADAYFGAIFLPASGTQVEIQTAADSVATGFAQAKEPHVGVAVGGDGVNQFGLFVGPKDLDTLRSVNPKLEQVVDFGWFAFLAKPLFLAVRWLNNQYLHNYGWSIVVVTIFINFILFPLKLTSLKSMKRMQVLQPEVAKINEKYKNVGMRDPRKQQQNQEVMDLYKKHGVNPMGGCVPMVLQIPFFIAFYKVLSVAVEMRGASWLWVTDLSQPEHLPIRILPIAMIVSQFIMQKMTPSTTADPMQQRIMLFMPLMLGFMFYGVSSGLVLYWFTSNLIGIGQQMFFNRTATPADVRPAQVKQKGGAKR